MPQTVNNIQHVDKDIDGMIILKLNSVISVLMACSSVEILQIVLPDYMALEPRTSNSVHLYIVTVTRT
jgi:hypothetical protein